MIEISRSLAVGFFALAGAAAMIAWRDNSRKQYREAIDSITFSAVFFVVGAACGGVAYIFGGGK